MRKTDTDASIIVAWIGTTDIDRAAEWRSVNGLPLPATYTIRDHARSRKLFGVEQKGENGPIRTLSDGRKARKIYLLCTEQFEDCAEMVRTWVLRGTQADCEVIRTGVKDPTDYAEVYRAADTFLRTRWTQETARYFMFNLTPGTPATQAVMLYLSHVRYAGGTAWIVVKKEYAGSDDDQCRQVNLPFRIPVEQIRADPGMACIDEQKRDELIKIYAQSCSVSILLLGETGVGKSSFARRIHESTFGSLPFVAVNCGEISRGDAGLFRSALFGHEKGAFSGAVDRHVGAFSRAEGGTLFLDEIGEIPPEYQTILLTALQTKEIEPIGARTRQKIRNIRIIAGTNRDLLTDVRQGRFRSDLYYRIAMFPVTLPPLRYIIRTHEEDFRRLLRDVLADIAGDSDDLRKDWVISEDAYRELTRHRWPGNIRELRHVLLLSCIYAAYTGTVTLDRENIEKHLAIVRPPEQLPDQDQHEDHDAKGTMDRECPERHPERLPEHLEEWLDRKRLYFEERAMALTGGSMRKAAALLGMTYQTFRYHYNRFHGDTRTDRK